MNNSLINGIRVYGFSSRQELIEFAAKEKKSLIALNAEKILRADTRMRSLINQNIGYADGIGAVMALKKMGFANAVKIPGCELWIDLISSYYLNNSFYLIGAKDDVIEMTVTKLRSAFPGIRFAGYRNGYIRSDKEKIDLIDDVVRKKPDIVFVAMGSPKQELLMQEMQQRHCAIYMGLGGSFDVYTGIVKRAPEWWIKNNLEWAHRLVRQPGRIVRQYVYVEFYLKLVLNKL